MGSMPELPDLRILADAFTVALAGRPLIAADPKQPLVLRGTGAELRAVRDGLGGPSYRRGLSNCFSVCLEPRHRK